MNDQPLHVTLDTAHRVEIRNVAGVLEAHLLSEIDGKWVDMGIATGANGEILVVPRGE